MLLLLVYSRRLRPRESPSGRGKGGVGRIFTLWRTSREPRVVVIDLLPRRRASARSARSAAAETDPITGSPFSPPKRLPRNGNAGNATGASTATTGRRRLSWHPWRDRGGWTTNASDNALMPCTTQEGLLWVCQTTTNVRLHALSHRVKGSVVNQSARHQDSRDVGGRHTALLHRTPVQLCTV